MGFIKVSVQVCSEKAALERPQKKPLKSMPWVSELTGGQPNL
jgi:hypothetical protein